MAEKPPENLYPNRPSEQWEPVNVTLWLDVGTYGSVPDDEEIAYLLRMGGIDAMSRAEAQDVG